MLLGVAQKRVDDRDDRLGADIPFFLRLPHQVMVRRERSVPVGAEVVLCAVELDVPEISRLAKKRLR